MRPTRPPPTTRRPRWGRVQQHQHHSTQRRAAPRHPHHATPRFNTPPRRTARRCFIHRPFSLSPEETTASGRQHFARMRTSLLHLAHCPCPLIHPTTTTYRAPQDPNFRPANWPPFPKSCYWPMSVLELILDLFGPLTPDLDHTVACSLPLCRRRCHSLCRPVRRVRAGLLPVSPCHPR